MQPAYGKRHTPVPVAAISCGTGHDGGAAAVPATVQHPACARMPPCSMDVRMSHGRRLPPWKAETAASVSRARNLGGRQASSPWVRD